jgi:hypothetical protein
MSECIWIHYARPRPQWYGLDAATQAAHEKTWATAADASLAAGGSRLGAEAAFEHWSALTAAAYGELNAFANNIGLATEGSP